MSDFSVTLQPPALAAFFHHRWRDWRIFCAISRRLRRGNFGRQCAFVFALYFFGILGLLLADVYYADDQFRAVTAQPNFLFSGRYIAEYGSSALSMQKWGVVLDWSPISQLLAIAILALGSVALARVVTGSRKTDYATLAAALPLGLAPWFLANLSYKYDAPFMALAVAVNVLPFLYMRRLALFMPLSVAALLVMLTSYQAASGMYPLLVLFVAQQRWIRGQRVGRIFMAGVISYAVALLLWRMFWFPPRGGEVALVGAAELLTNMKALAASVRSDIRGSTFKQLCLAAALLFVLHSAYSAPRGRRAAAGALALSFCAAGPFLAYGLALFLNPVRFDVRTFCGMGTFLALLATGATVGAASLLKTAGRALALVLAYNLIIISTVYANSLAAQEKYMWFRYTMMMSDLIRMMPGQVAPATRVAACFEKPMLKGRVLENTEKYLPVLARVHDEFINIIGAEWNKALHIDYIPDFASLWSANPCQKKCSAPAPLATYENQLNRIRQFPDNCWEIYYK